MSFEAGSIYYTIKADTGALLTADKEVSSFNRRAQEGFEKTGASMSKLTTIAKAVSAALVSNTVIAYAQSWNELEDRIQNTGATASQTKDILDQLVITSNRNGRQIEESSELYIRLSNSMGELGYSTQSTLSYIDTLSNLLTIDKTKALGAESAINALTKAQIKGKLAGLEAMSVFGAMPTVLKILGKQLNKTEAEVQKMAMDGKLSMSQFTNAMIEAQQETSALADNMRNNIQDGMNRIANNAKRYLGELNNSTGATKTLVDALILMSEHIDILMTSVGVLAAIYAGKYITSLASATKQSAEKTIADMRQAQAEKVLLQAEVERASQNVKALQIQRQNIIIAQAHCNNLKVQMALNQQLTVVEKQLATATNEHTAAQARLDKAVKATSFAARGLQATMAMLGGPAGIILLTAGALMTWSSKASEAKQKALELTDEVAALAEKYKGLSKAQREAFAIDLKKQVFEQNKAIERQVEELDKINKKLELTRSGRATYGRGNNRQEKIADLEKRREEIKKTIAVMQEGFNKAVDLLAEVIVKNHEAADSTDKVAKSTNNLSDSLNKTTQSKIDEKIKSLSTELEISEMKLSGAKKAAYIYESALSELGDESDKYKVALLGLINGTAEWADMSDEVRKTLEPLLKALGKMFDANEKLNASKKSGRSTTKSYAEEVKELSDKLEVAKLEARGMTVEAELLAITQKMGGKVTAQQTAELKKLIEASQAYKALGSLKSPIEAENDSFNQSKESLDNLYKLSELKHKKEEYYTKLEQLEKQHQINLAKIKSDAVVSDIDNAVAQVDPVLALENEHKRKLALIQEFETRKWTSEQNAIALREAANRQFEQNRINAQWEIWRNQSDANEFLASSLEGLASSATSTISGLMSGTMTATQAMQNFANVILNEAIGSLVQMGMQYVKNAIVEQSTSAAATAAHITEAAALAAAYQPAAMLASIATQGAAADIGAESYIAALGTMKAATIAGGRLRGGGVDAGKAYRVNESGQAEMFVAQGKQYMIPNKNGEIIPSNKLSNGGSRTIVNNITQNISFGDGQNNADAANETARALKQALKAVIQEEQRPGGLLNRR